MPRYLEESVPSEHDILIIGGVTAIIGLQAFYQSQTASQRREITKLAERLARIEQHIEDEKNKSIPKDEDLETQNPEDGF